MPMTPQKLRESIEKVQQLFISRPVDLDTWSAWLDIKLWIREKLGDDHVVESPHIEDILHCTKCQLLGQELLEHMATHHLEE